MINQLIKIVLSLSNMGNRQSQRVTRKTGIAQRKNNVCQKQIFTYNSSTIQKEYKTLFSKELKCFLRSKALYSFIHFKILC